MKKKIAVCVGTFDPLTIGHLWIIEQGAAIFDKLIVATGINPDKQCMFSVIDRLDMLRKSVESFPNIEIGIFTSQSIVTYAQSMGARFMLRGIRNESDYEHEHVIRNIHEDLNPNITTIFLMPPRQIAEVSSSMVKGLVGSNGWETIVRGYVSEIVFKKLKEADF